MLEQILFVLLAVITLSSGIVVVTHRNLFHAALALMVSFAGVAGFYITLDAGFLAAAQLLVYIGAISILVIFAIMMTRRLMQATEKPFNSQRGLGIVGALLTLVIMAFVITQYWPVAPSTEVPMASKTIVEDAIVQGSVAELGRSFVSVDAFVIPFEVASILLLAALVGAILVAWPKAEDQS
ncbi:MAG: NADH-quinone oxidoreductase subunit J [Candidatus Promineifilaceae bacterium]|nr:NADH-quinone oxidoreductase subunit J [Candidatus Promineifilaceae bacterium]